jgi:hypothetical protein
MQGSSGSLPTSHEVDCVLNHDITVDSAAVCAIASFACEFVADVCDRLLEACRKHASCSLHKSLRESTLYGVGACHSGVGAASGTCTARVSTLGERAMLRRASGTCSGGLVQTRGLQWRARYAQPEEVKWMSEMLELSLLPASFVSEHVQTSGLVSRDKLLQTH